MSSIACGGGVPAKLELSPMREAIGKPKEADEEETFSDNFWQSIYRLPNLTEEVFTGLLVFLYARCPTGTSRDLGTNL